MRILNLFICSGAVAISFLNLLDTIKTYGEHSKFDNDLDELRAMINEYDLTDEQLMEVIELTNNSLKLRIVLHTLALGLFLALLIIL